MLLEVMHLRWIIKETLYDIKSEQLLPVWVHLFSEYNIYIRSKYAYVLLYTMYCWKESDCDWAERYVL